MDSEMTEVVIQYLQEICDGLEGAEILYGGLPPEVIGPALKAEELFKIMNAYRNIDSPISA